MEPASNCPFGFYNEHSTWEPAAGKVCWKAPHSDGTIFPPRELIKAAVIKKRD